MIVSLAVIRPNNRKTKQFFVAFLLSLSLSVVIAQTTETDDPEIVVELEQVTITSQHGNQHLLDIPAAITAVSGQMLESANINNFEQLAAFVPGLNILTQTPGRPNLVIRGLTSDEVSPAAQPRVSVYLNHAPISRATMAVTELYDMERVEVMKGPQGTLFGRGSQAGAISFITRKPTDRFGGYVTAGAGNYGMMHLESALNVPITKTGVSARIAGIYSYRDGYVKNNSGGTLNDKNTLGGRFSASYAPQNGKFKADLTVNYQKDDHSGTAFINPNGVRDIFNYEVSLDRDKEFYNRREVFGTILNARYYTGEQNYFSSITSYFNNTADSRFDGDGSSAPAIDMGELVKANQFMQEIRYNFSSGNRITGIAGASFWREDVSHTYRFHPNEQYAAWLIFQMPGLMMYGNPMREQAPMPERGITEHLYFPDNHEEESITGAVNNAFDLFFDATYKLLPKLSFTAGVRATFERFSIKNRAYHSGGDPSTLGQWFVFADINRETGYINAPNDNASNFFFAPVENPTTEKSFSALTWRASLQYEVDSHSNVFAGYSRGRRPNVLQYNSAGELSVIDAETLHSFDAGYKLVSHRFMFDASLYYQLYRNFQSSMWEGMNYLVVDVERATSCGAELSAKAVVNSYLNVFGNYAYAHAVFDDKDSDGNPQGNAGNSFRLTPRNSFLIGLNASVDISQNMNIVLTPTYSWKSHIWFEDANDEGIEQDACGLLNANLSLRFKRQGLTVSLFGSNLTGEKYLIGAGNMGAMFGIPTFVPGAPRMLGGKLTWKF
jgi:outer membrane receptor protein involved in Fe transport